MNKWFLSIIIIMLLLPNMVSAVLINKGDLIISEILPYGKETGSIYSFNPVTKSLNVIVSGNPIINNPEKMAIDADGKIIVTDWWSWENPTKARSGPRGIYSVDPSSGSVEYILKDGPLITPVGVVIANNGDLIVIDHGTNAAQGQVLRIDPATGAVLKTSKHSNLYSPQGIVKDKKTGKIYMADHNGYIFSINEDTLELTSIGRVPVPGKPGWWSLPQDLIVTGNNNLIIVTLEGMIYLMDPLTGASKLIFNDEQSGDFVPGSSSFDSLEWIDEDTFAVINHFSAGDIFAFDYNSIAETITSSEVLFNDGKIYGGPLYIPLGIEKYDVEIVPEPSTLLLFGAGFALVCLYGKRYSGKLNA